MCQLISRLIVGSIKKKWNVSFRIESNLAKFIDMYECCIKHWNDDDDDDMHHTHHSKKYTVLVNN